MFGPIGFPELIMILVIAMLLFGPKKIPEIGRSLGKGIREFKKSTSGLMDGLNAEVNQTPKPAAAPPAAQAAATPAPAPAAEPPEASEPVKRTATVIDMESDGKQG